MYSKIPIKTDVCISTDVSPYVDSTGRLEFGVYENQNLLEIIEAVNHNRPMYLCIGDPDEDNHADELEITDVKSFNDTVTIVHFSDGTREKSICAPEDMYSLETGIAMCILKKALGGQKEYNKIHDIAKAYQKKIEAAAVEAGAKRIKRKVKKYNEQCSSYTDYIKRMWDDDCGFEF